MYTEDTQPTPRNLADYFNDSDTKPKSLFLGEPIGLIENLDNRHPEIWDLYKKLKSLDWEESEIDISSCRSEFKTRPTEIINLVKRTLAFQFEADSSAAHIARLMYPFINNTELMCYITELAKNECLTPDHQVLTPTGWKNIDEVTKLDVVAQWYNSSISFVQVDDVIKLDYEGDIHHITSTDNAIDQRVTDTHRIPVKRIGKDNFTVRANRAKTLDITTFEAIPVSGNKENTITELHQTLPDRYKMYIAANCAAVIDKTDRDLYTATFKISKAKRFDDKENFIKMCDSTNWDVCQTQQKEGYLETYIPVCDMEVDTTRLHWLNLTSFSRYALVSLLDEIEKWFAGEYLYKTYYKEDAVKIMTALHLVGLRGMLVTSTDKEGVERFFVKRVSESEVGGSKIVKTSEPYKGTVYCITIPSSYFLVKRNDVISVTGNCLHSLAYKFIVESSFEDPNEFLSEVRSIKEAYLRLSNVSKVFQETLELGSKYTLGLVTDETVIRKALLKFWVTMYALERIQFISSFAVTFGLAERGLFDSMFVPIAKLVQKISTDEWQIHVAGDKAILKNELSIPEIFALWLEIIPDVQQIVYDVIAAETDWLDDYLFKEEKVIAGIECSRVKSFVQYTAQDVCDFLKIPLTWDRHHSNPLPYMDKWLVIDKNQASPQEESIGNYLLGGFIDDSESVDMSKYQSLVTG